MTLKPKIKFLTDPKGDGVIQTKYADIFSIELLPDNIKAHDIEGIKQSIRDHGFVEPIGINRTTGHDIFGNGRLEALRSMFSDGEHCPRGIIEKKGIQRWWYAPIVDGIEMDTQQEIALAIRMNKLNEAGGIDPTKAIAVLTRLKESEPERFLQTGYVEADLDRIRELARFQRQVAQFQDTTKQGSAISDAPGIDNEDRESFAKRLNKKWKVKKGDLWQIGNHRLACVDSKDTGKLQEMFGVSHRLCFTSPPYDTQRSYELDPDFNWTEMMDGVSDTIFQGLSDPGDVIINLGVAYQDKRVKMYWNDWLEYCNDHHGMPLYGWYVWDRLVGYPGNFHGRLGRSHEFLFHFSRGNAQANKWVKTTGETIKRGPIGWTQRTSDGGLKNIGSIDTFGQEYKIPDSVVRLNADMSRGIHTQGHPAVFPVALAEFVIKTWSNPKDIVYEPFCGSGTTMIAAENLDRICHASEISSNYCAVALERIHSLFPSLEIKKL
jgi:DNA modification methylase